MKIETSPCAHCEGKDDENCPCIDKTVYDINMIDYKKQEWRRASVECYTRRRCNEFRAKRQRRYFG